MVTMTGTLTSTQVRDIRQAVCAAERRSGLRFAVYLGPAAGPCRHFSERLHAALGEEADTAVLVFVDPGGRAVEVVTGPAARLRLSDGECRVAAVSMATAFDGGNLVGGLVTGMWLLADLASRRR
ncbi:DUF5130 family protein [Streptosporangium sp. NPDC051023]|uniref:DUF5130 family protein n=1 Tax=Streptosporangium sp. NPDC051023 TaxID=3155410 RepID=UPI00344B08A7